MCSSDLDNTDKAITMACQETGASVTDYTAAPIYFTDTANGAHEWLIEFEHAPPSLQQFSSVLDHALQRINSDYEAKRHRNIALRAPVIHPVKRGIFADWLRNKGKLGGQHKVPRLSNDRHFLEEILQLNNPTFVTI